MTPAERDLIFALCVAPGRPQPISREEFLRRFGASDGTALALDLLRDAVKRRDPVDVEWALIVGFKFGFSGASLPLLLELSFADWHQRHEDVAWALGDIRSPQSVEALEHLARWVPVYLEFDDSRALATKAIWGLGLIEGEDAERALSALALAEDRIVAEGAAHQLDRRRHQAP